MIGWAKSCGIVRKITLLSRIDNDRALGLYERFGFVEYGRERRFIKEGKDHYLTKVMMQKKLV